MATRFATTGYAAHTRVARGPRRLTRVLAKLGLLAVTSVLCLGLVEVGIRIAQPQPASWLHVYRVHPRMPIFALDVNRAELVDTGGETTWTVHTDAAGFRVGATPIESRGLPTALWLGDSYAFGHGVNYEDSWIGRLARDPQRSYEHVNAGCPGYGPTQYADMLDDLLAQGMKPSFVVVASFLGNDFHDAIWDKTKFHVTDGVPGDDGSFKARLKRTSHLYRVLSKVKRTLHVRPPEERLFTELKQPAAWASGLLQHADVKYREGFARIAKACEQHGIPFVAVLIPALGMVDAYRAQGDPGDADVADERLPIVHARRTLDALGVRYLDLTPELAKHPTFESYLRYDQHFSPAGHARVTELLPRAFPQLGSATAAK